MSKVFRKIFNRIGCINLILLVLVVLIWAVSYIYPLYKIDFQKARLFYGTLDYVRLQPGFNKLSIRINRDPDLKLTLWLGDEDLELFKANYNDYEAMGIWAFDTGNDHYLVFSLESDSWALNPDSIIENYSRLRFKGSFIIIFLFLLFFWMLKEYFVWFRYRPWGFEFDSKEVKPKSSDFVNVVTNEHKEEVGSDK